MKILDTAMGLRGYRGSPAEREDRALGIKTGGRARWLVTPPITGTITRVEVDADGEPWFHLTFPTNDKDVRVARTDIAEV